MNEALNGKKVLIFGGSGFIGSHLVKNLCTHSCQIEVLSRRLNYKSSLFLGNEPGQIKYKHIKDFKQESIDNLVSGADVVINLIGILYEKKKSTFEFVHSMVPKMIAKACKKNKVRYFLHMSALNVDKVKDSNYALSKIKGEKLAKENFKDTTIIRPGVVFGKGDNFTNFFYNLSKISPILPLIGTPEILKKKKFIPKIDFKKRVKFQPIYVVDLVNFIISKCLSKSNIFELAGPVICSFEEIFDIILNSKKKKDFTFQCRFLWPQLSLLF
jgi:NADH dehydrogenase